MLGFFFVGGLFFGFWFDYFFLTDIRVKFLDQKSLFSRVCLSISLRSGSFTQLLMESNVNSVVGLQLRAFAGDREGG